MDDNTPPPTGLENIPGIGPARRAALEAAGITTRAALAQASVEQMVSMTGMPRVQAERVLQSLRGTPETGDTTTDEPATETAPPPPPEPAATDETLPTPDGDLPTVEASEPSAPEPEPSSDLERALLSAQTALSDATRTLAGVPALTKPLVRFSPLLDRLAARADQMKPKRRRKITAQLLQLTKRWEKIAARLEDGKVLPLKRLSERFKQERRELAELLPAKPKRKG